MSAVYDYAEPFSCECRAFGRLYDAGHEELAVGCFGYILLDEDHEPALHDRFADIDFNGDMAHPGGDDMRSCFRGATSPLACLQRQAEEIFPAHRYRIRVARAHLE